MNLQLQAELQTTPADDKKGLNFSLGNHGKSVSGFDEKIEVSHRENKKKQQRSDRFNLQRKAAELLPNHMVKNCLWAVASTLNYVDVIHNFLTKKSRFTNLQTCKSVWSCPCCSNSISEKRRVELNNLLIYARKEKLHPVMLTLTVKHSLNNDLYKLLDSLKKAKQRLINHWAFKKVKAKLVGSVTATEVTGGGLNGWHPHFHVIFLLKTSTDNEALELIKTLKNPWLVSLKAENLDGSDAAFQVQNASAAGKYITKWGAAEELALSGKKKGRAGRTPFQLLADYAEGDENAGFLFQEYSRVFRGRRQLVWSPGLKNLAGINELSDEKILEDEVRKFEESLQDKLIHSFTHEEWKKVRHQRSEILDEAEELYSQDSTDFGV